MSETRAIALFGAAGKMGREILRQVWRFDALRMARGFDISHIGEQVETLLIEAPPKMLPPDVRVAMDFSVADAVAEHVKLALDRGTPYLTGVTGLSEETRKVLVLAADRIPVLFAPNMSAGMNVMFKLAHLSAKALPGYERHIFEVHHAAKADSPSGTALHLARAVHEAVKEDTKITALRMGDVTGEHRIVFGGPGERLEIIHHADSRAVFAVGALRAAAWLLKQKPDLYSMADVLELNTDS